jgi:phosphoribosylanthranilate isomerase
LNPENIADAVFGVRPTAIDTASGVESAPGRKDAGKMRALVTAVTGA